MNENDAGRMIVRQGDEFVVWHQWGHTILDRFPTAELAETYVKGYLRALDYAPSYWDEHIP
jgi:hypothetical protein